MSQFIGFHLINRLLTVVLFGNAYEVDAKHPKYKEIVAKLKLVEGANATPAQKALLEHARANAILQLIQSDDKDFRHLAAAVGMEDVKVDHGLVTVKGVPLHNTLTKRLLELKEAGLPYDSFVAFLVNVNQNPNPESVEDLFDFLDRGKFGFTDDGCFLGYKAVVKGSLPGVGACLVDKHSRSYNMNPGQKHSMPREEVCANRDEACGAGFHIGTKQHATGFGGDAMIVVKCNPKDVVSVPRHDQTKLRCCAYEIVHLFENRANVRELAKPVYAAGDTDYEAPAPVKAAQKDDFSDLTKDKLARLVAERGILVTVKAAKSLTRDRMLEALELGGLAYKDMSAEELADLCVALRVYSTPEAGRKAGRKHMVDRIILANTPAV